MYNFLISLPGTYLLLLLSAVTIGISAIALNLVKRYIPHDIRSRDNAVIGVVSSLISLIYGVLAGLTALYLINNINYADDAVQREANAIADIYRDSSWLNDSVRIQIQKQIKDYILTVVNVEWPLMARGDDLDKDGDVIVENINQTLKKCKINTNSDMLILREMLVGLKNLYDAREQRIAMSFSALTPELWVVIIIGTILMLLINYLYAMNYYMHLISVSALALMLSAMIYLLLSLDKPFRGDFVVEPDAYKTVLKYINQHEAQFAELAARK